MDIIFALQSSAADRDRSLSNEPQFRMSFYRSAATHLSGTTPTFRRVRCPTRRPRRPSSDPLERKAKTVMMTGPFDYSYH